MTARTLVLTALFRRYFLRKVLAVGALRSPLVRFAFGCAAALLFVVATFASYLFLRSAGAGLPELHLILQVSSFSLFFWVLILVILGRVLFLRSRSFLTFTLQLPVTNAQRTAALTMFEAGFVLSAALLLVLPLGLASACALGWAAVPALLTGLVFPVAVFYAALTSAHNLAERLLERLGFGRVARPLVIALFALGAALFDARLPALIAGVSGDYLQHRTLLHGLDLFAYAHERWGVVAATSMFVAVLFPLLWLMVSTTPTRPPLNRQFVRLGAITRWPGAIFRLYLAATVRRVESVTLLALTYAIAVVMACRSADYVLCVGMLAVNGLYAHSGTTSLRHLPGRRWSPAGEFWLLTGAQVVPAMLCAAPVLAMSAYTDGPWAPALALGGLLSGSLVTVFLGIQFLPERDNPFAVFVSLAVCLCCLGCAAAVVGVLALPAWLIVVGAIGAHAACVGLGISGMTTLQRKARHVHA